MTGSLMTWLKSYFFYFFWNRNPSHMNFWRYIESYPKLIIFDTNPRFSPFLAHLSPRLKGELIVYPCSGVRCRCCRRQPFSNMNISKASRPIAIKFYLKHHWGRGNAAWGFGADQFRTLVSMATDSSHRVIMGKTASSRFLECF